MDETTHTLITLGGLFLLGLVTDLIGRHTPLPRVTLLLLAGLSIGPSGFDLLPGFSEQWFPMLTDIALVMIGFLLGQKMTVQALRRRGRTVLLVSMGEILMTAVLIAAGLMALGVRPEIALLMAGIAPATAPAATMDVVRELGTEGEFSQTLLGIVAIDDAWGLIIFSVMVAIVQGMQGGGEVLGVLGQGMWEVGGAFALGIALGLPMAYLTGRIRDGEPTQAEALGLVFLCGGIANWMEVSYILAAMVMGAVVASRAHHHTRPFHAIEGIEWPFMILFFVLAGASLHVESLLAVGGLGLAYIVLRVSGKVSGVWITGSLAGAAPSIRRWMGVALMPQAGVALGMALLANQRFPEIGETLLPVVIGATVVFELVGPVVMRNVLVHVEQGRTGREAGND